MKRLLTAAAALFFLAACTNESPEPGVTAENAPEPTWSVACASGSTAIEGVGDLELDCLGDEAATVVGPGEKPLVVVLWASWCGPCQDEAPEVEAFYQAYGDQVDVLGVDTADTRDAGRSFAEAFGMTFPSVFDPDEAVRIGLGVPGLPGIAFVKPDGTVAALIAEPGVTAESLTETAESAFGLEPA
ncbi:TlpA disulfide reductase family protein [Glycomyces luteolus]|uniref:TlpA disulfide reductase family protein n=1 Tax=Glycomyces luteolus TaxID=2670330 RepID=A0A9X3P8G4_9ACTN|nr:TlpA disulfide reductase family protein [Glycomyces luteolus]MDA1360663.1 TlpA disulfide reductase family protein [Glycomyces luteolus]